MIEKIIKYLDNKNLAILGFGMEGKSSYRLIRKYLPNIHLTIIDKKNILENNPYLQDDKNIDIIYGDDYLNDLEKYDLVIKGPGVITKDIDVSKINFTSQLELLLKYHKQNTIGVTATKGKSTTVSLLYEVLKANHKDVCLLGNIGNSIFDYIEEMNEDTIAVVEMAALQLEFVDESPHIGAIINLYEDHLDHAGTLEHYHTNKLNMFKYQNENDYSVYCTDIEPLNSYITDKYKGIKYGITFNNENKNNITHILNDYVYLNNNKLYNINDKRHLQGDIYLRNIMIVLTIANILGLDQDITNKTINEFKGLEHRLELVGTIDDVIYYNDSIATIPAATMNAIKTLKEVDTLIFGGMDRGIHYQEFIDFLNTGVVRNLICMPTTGYKIGKEITNKNINVYYIEMLEDAVKLAKEITRKKKICLLSPAASSYEYFKNFEEKGRAFKMMVKNK